LANAVPADLTAPEGTQLIIDRRLGKIWVDGVEILGLRAGTHPFRFVETLATRAPSPIAAEELTKILSDARKDGDTTARQAKAAANKNIREAMQSVGKAFEDPFPSVGTGYYRCSLIAHVV
jgi:hypothetical protein